MEKAGRNDEEKVTKQSNELSVKNVSISSIVPYEKNAKIHTDEQVWYIANSIREFGWKQPIVVDKNNVVIIGHGRLLAAHMLGLDKVPVLRADDLSEDQVRALRLADNKTNESPWDLNALYQEILGIKSFDMSDFGFDLSFEEPDEPEVGMDEEEETSEIICPRCGYRWI